MKRTVHCRLGGGLGNQLFRYAAARALAIELGADSVFEVGGFDRDSFGREYLLDAFEGPRGFRKTRLRDSIWGRLLLRFRSRGAGCLQERDFLYEPPGAANVGRTRVLILEGYWQSEIYFEKHREAILKELRFRPELDEANLEWLKKIESASEPVALHFRSYKEVKAGVPGKIMGSEYYRAACEAIRERFPNADFFLFTDDATSAHEALGKDFPARFVDPNSGGGEQAGLRDLYLMSRCRHFVTANSSFSWWGAWLSQNCHVLFDSETAERIAYFPSEKLSHPEMVPTFGRILAG